MLTDDDLEYLKNVSEGFKESAELLVRWLRVSHAALRLRCESTSWAWQNAALQTRRYMCFSQAVKLYF